LPGTTVVTYPLGNLHSRRQRKARSATLHRCAPIGLVLLHELTFWSARDVAREARAPFHAAPHRRSVRVITLSTSPIRKLRAANDERRQAKRNSLADKLTVEAKALADLKIEKAAVEGQRRKVEADLGPVKYLATMLGAKDDDVLRYFILVVALLLDPAAVLLLLAATGGR
jgi:hypothetical protein